MSMCCALVFSSRSGGLSRTCVKFTDRMSVKWVSAFVRFLTAAQIKLNIEVKLKQGKSKF